LSCAVFKALSPVDRKHLLDRYLGLAVSMEAVFDMHT
jgi:hypothetical protein